MTGLFSSDLSILTASEDYQQRLLHQSSGTSSVYNKKTSTETKSLAFKGEN
jgi:hypothetical protein